jgi:hypothetical protein
VDQHQCRAALGGLEEIDPITVAWTVSQVEMRGMFVPHGGGALLPARDKLGAARDGGAVVESEVALLLAHRSPVRLAEYRRHRNVLECCWLRIHFP